MNNPRLLLILMLVLFPGTVPRAMTLPDFKSVPGGIAVVPINAKQKPDAYYKGKRVMVLGTTGDWHAVIGLPEYTV